MIIIIFMIFIILIINNYYNTCDIRDTYDYFTNNNDNYLYPIKGLTSICAKDNLLPSYMPKACYIDGNMNSYANCKCQDKEGNCKICYDNIKKDDNNSSIIYNANIS